VLDDFVTVEWATFLLEDIGDNIRDGALFVAPFGEGVNAAADKNEALVFDKFVVNCLKKEGGPLHRDEIVKRVLKSRQVRETTILLNLQSKPEFKRVAKATYELRES
jgi:hypothetical protein